MCARCHLAYVQLALAICVAEGRAVVKQLACLLRRVDGWREEGKSTSARGRGGERKADRIAASGPPAERTELRREEWRV